MNWQQKLREFFISLDLLNDKEITIYSILLLKNQPVNEINHRLSSESVKITRTNIYKILDSLGEKNLIYTIPGNPTLYAANNPIDFVNNCIKEAESKLNELNKLRSYIEKELNPQLKKTRESPTIPIRKTYFLESLESLKTNIFNLLTECSYRLNLQAPLWFFNELDSHLYDKVKKLHPRNLDPKNKLHSTNRYRLLFIIDEDPTDRQANDNKKEKNINKKNLKDISNKLDPYVVKNPLPTNSILLVIDQSIIIFNFTLAQYQNEVETKGTGFIIHDEKIAASYHHQFLHRFREHLYQYLPNSNLNEIPEQIKENRYLSDILLHLFEKGFKLDPIESILDINYLEIIPPKTDVFPLYREVGFQFFFSSESINPNVLSSRYKESKEFLIKELNQRPNDAESGFQLEDEVQKTIAGFNCFSINAIMRGREMHDGNKNKKLEITSHPFYNIQLVVFAFTENIIIGIWSLSDKINEYILLFKHIAEKADE